MANQYLLDPRQKLCWDSYINPKSETFGNGTQSAIKAGYDPAYADQITTIDWFLGKLRRLNMLDKAEKVLDKTLTLDTMNDEGKTDVGLLRVQTDVAKHITSTLGRNEGYSTKQEIDHTTKGESLNEENIDTDAITAEVVKRLKEQKI